MRKPRRRRPLVRTRVDAPVGIDLVVLAEAATYVIRTEHKDYLTEQGSGALRPDRMPWPDVTLIPEGALTRLVWFKGHGLAGQPVTFLTSGDVFVPTTGLRAELTE